MSVTSVSTNLPQLYGPLSGTQSPRAKFTPSAEQTPSKTVSQGDVTPDEVSLSLSSLAEALRADALTSDRSASAGSGSGRSSGGAALYKLVSQMATSDPSTSALLENWNSIMQTGNVGNAGSESSSFHLTA